MQEKHLPDTLTRLQGLDDFVRGVLKDWQGRGVALAIVQGDEVIYAQGFGLRDEAQTLPVTTQTLFPIASCTKAFTAASLAILADRGKLDWDTPVREYLPAFKLYDPLTSERVTARDLMSHRTGLPRHDLSWYHNTALTREEFLRRLRYLEPTKDFRSFWQYQNLMYMAAGCLVEEIAGQPWEPFIRQHFFQPLEMTRSNFSMVQTALEDSDHSRPYRKQGNEVREIPFFEADTVCAPAGAIVSCIAEMSNWVVMQLNRGKYKGRQIISETQLQQMHTPQMVVPESGQYSEMPYASYALGWNVKPYRGSPMITHSGGIDGFRALTTLFPAQKTGVIVLSNMHQLNIPEILTYNVFERLLGLDETRWNERFLQEYGSAREAEQKGKEQSEQMRIANTSPSHALEAYTGDFEHPGYGIFSVTLKEGTLQGLFNGMSLPIRHYHYDIFELLWEQWDEAMKISFLTNVRGDIATLVTPFEPTGNDIVFKRIPDRKMRERTFLEQFVGVYELLDMQFVVSLKQEHTLSVSVPGQSDYQLEPYKENTFLVKGSSDKSIAFQRDTDGTVTGLDATLPQGVFHASRT